MYIMTIIPDLKAPVPLGLCLLRQFYKFHVKIRARFQQTVNELVFCLFV